MGMGEYRGVITVVTFLAVTLIIMGGAAAQTPTFFSGSPSGTSPLDTNVNNPTNLLAWNQTSAVILNSSHTSQSYDIPNWHSTWWLSGTYYGGYGIHVYTYDTWWIFETNQEDLTWYNETTGQMKSSSLGGTPIMYLSTLNTSYDNEFNLNYRLTNTRGSLHVTVSWNASAYSTTYDAYLGTGIVISLKQDFSDRQTSLNLLDIISGLFLGSIFGSNTLGIDPTISAILSIALDSALVYIVFTIVRSLIPFLPGGD